MRLAIFNDYRLGVVDAAGQRLTDVTAELGGRWEPEAFGAGWWLRLCRDFDELRPQIEAACDRGEVLELETVVLRAPVLNPGKIVATAMNYADHVDEMRDTVLQRVAGRVDPALLDFDVFLKATSSIVGPGSPVVLPAIALREQKEVHHEGELGVVIGRAGIDIREEDALGHVLGYVIGLDMVLRGHGDRSRRKSYDTFTPLGPWLTTADEIGDPKGLDIHLSVGGATRQRANTDQMIVSVPGIIAHASSIMRLEPGDVILTGAPPGVGEVNAGDTVDVTISKLGTLEVHVTADDAARQRALDEINARGGVGPRSRAGSRRR